MKKIILSALVSVVCSLPVMAKKVLPSKKNPKGYFRAGMNYSFPIAADYRFMNVPISGTGQEFAGNPEPMSFKMKKGSYSSGFYGTLAGGFMFTKHVGIDVAVSIGAAMKKYQYKESSPVTVNDYVVTRTSYARNPVIIMPSLVFSSGPGNIEGFGRVGFAICPGSKIVLDDDYSATGVSQLRTMEIKNKPAIGITGAAGIKYHISEAFGLWLEVNGVGLNPQARSGEVTELRQNGNSYLSYLTVEERQIEFSNEYTQNSLNTTSGIPTRSGPVSAPFSNIGAGIGVSIEF